MKKIAIGLIAFLVMFLGGAVVLGVLATRPRPAAPPPQVYPSAPATLRTVSTGKVLGFQHPAGGHAWLGLPYAEPPMGDLRWKPPVPAAPEPGTREAVRFGEFCTQYSSPLTGASVDATESQPVGQEDCLYLNVWAPALATEDVAAGKHALPVMVWIHGGGNSVGHGGNVDGGRLASAHDLVVVSINYRLGPLGWFRHPALSPGDPGEEAVEAAGADGGLAGPDAGVGDPDAGVPVAVAAPLSKAELLEASGNFANLDVIQALRWVRANIAAFGGDPKNVTLFGESAGARNTLSTMASPLAAGLFHRAIVQSGAFRDTPTAMGDNYADDEPAGSPFSGPEVVNKLLVADGKAEDRDAAKALQEDMSPEEIVAYLRGKTAVEILSVFEGRFGGMIDFPGSFSDGYVLPASPAHVADVFADRTRFHDVPVILGTNRDEQKLFMVRNPEHVERRFGIFPRFKDRAGYMRFAKYMSDAWKVRGADDIARAMTKAGHAQVFVYRWDWDEEASVLGFDLSEALGAAHGLEIAFAFGHFGGPLSSAYLYDETKVPARDALSSRMMGYWAQFAYTGTPGRGRDGKGASWLPWGKGGHTFVFDTNEGGGIRMSSDQLTYADLKERLRDDPSFTDRKERCVMYVRLFRGAEGVWDDDEYAAFGEGGCEDVDPDDVSWF